MGRRAETQQQLLMLQIAEINRLTVQLKDAIDVADLCERGLVVIGRPTAVRVLRNMEDLKKRFLVGMIK